MTALRNRLVTEQNGRQHVSSILITTEEIPSMLACEIIMHEANGWTTRRYGQMIRFEKGNTVRWVWVRSRTREEDTLE